MYPIEYVCTYNIDEPDLHYFGRTNMDRLVFELIDLAALADFINKG